MKIIRNTTEQDMVATFLRAEINSQRFGQFVLSRLQRDGKNRSIIDNPDLSNQSDNQYRKQLLGEYRGFGSNQYLFAEFPTDVKWQRVLLNREDLGKIKYANYSYWIDLSDGSRDPKYAVKNIKNGIEILGESNARFIEVAEEVKKGKKFTEIILISTNPKGKIVVIEGHLRLTAYILAGSKMPKKLEVIIGYSDEFVNYGLY